LVLSHGALDTAFRTSDTTYAVTLPDTVASLTLTPTAAAASSVIRVNGTTVVASGSPTAALPMSVGTTTVTLAVTAQDGTTKKTYTVKFYRGEWRQLGGLVSGTASTSMSAIVANGSELWVAYIDTLAGNKIKAKRYANNAWSPAMNISDSIGRAFDMYAENGNVWIAYTQGVSTYRLSVKRWNGTSWSTWNNLNTTYTYPPSITVVGGVPYVAYSALAGTAYKASVKYLSGAVWQFIDEAGAGSDTTAYYSRIVPYSTTGIVLLTQEYDYAASAYKLSAKRWTTGATVFTNLGKYVTPGATSGISAVGVGTVPYVAFVDGANSSRFSVKRYSSTTNWPNLGDAGFSTVGMTGYPTSIFHTGSQFYAAGLGYSAATSYQMLCYQFDGTEWLPVGGKHPAVRAVYNTAYLRQAMTVVNKNTYIVFSDANQSNQVVVYEHYDPTP
jgi:Cadherin-like beta sandwich domain